MLFVFCGMFWLFAAIHIRDAMVLLAVSLLTLYWVRLLAFRTGMDFVRLGLATAVGFLSFGLLREELVFVPLGMMGAGCAAVCWEGGKRDVVGVLLALVLAGGIIAYFVTGTTRESLAGDLVRNWEAYGDLSLLESREGSLGNKLIVEQAVPVRLILGSAYLFVYPIPFWSGFQLESSYHVFKSQNVLFMYAVSPLLGLAVWRVMRGDIFRRAVLLFLLFVVTGFALGVAATSLEGRHFGVFFVPLLVFALIPDLSDPRERAVYWRTLVLYLGVIAVVHLTWVILKGIGA
jgi:hypothetical protein